MNNLKNNKLPEFLIKRYKVWKSKDYKKNQTLYKKLVIEGQKPKIMVITCCDSRVNPNLIFGSSIGELFIYRNVANIVPIFKKNIARDGVFSAIEYGIKCLNIKHLIILGHSDCGGIKHGINKFSNSNYRNDLVNINLWIKSFSKLFNVKNKKKYKKNFSNTLEKDSIKFSIANLKNFLKNQKLNNKNEISIHGLWYDISNGSVLQVDKSSNDFIDI